MFSAIIIDLVSYKSYQSTFLGRNCVLNFFRVETYFGILKLQIYVIHRINPWLGKCTCKNVMVSSWTFNSYVNESIATWTCLGVIRHDIIKPMPHLSYPSLHLFNLITMLIHCVCHLLNNVLQDNKLILYSSYLGLPLGVTSIFM